MKKTRLYAERDEEKCKEFINEVKEIEADKLVYLDESGIDKFLDRDYARAKRGEKVFSEVKGKKYQRVTMIAAQCKKSVLAPLVFNGTTDTKVFNHWLEHCLLPELKPNQVVIMDNYIIHKSAKTKALIESVGCKVKFLPPYSPHLNPIEHLWANIKKKIKHIKHKFTDFNDAIDHAFKSS